MVSWNFAAGWKHLCPRDPLSSLLLHVAPSFHGHFVLSTCSFRENPSLITSRFIIAWLCIPRRMFKYRELILLLSMFYFLSWHCGTIREPGAERNAWNNENAWASSTQFRSNSMLCMLVGIVTFPLRDWVSRLQICSCMTFQWNSRRKRIICLPFR